MDNIWQVDGGRISWLENCGDDTKGDWTRRTIGHSPGMHRLKAGHFTRNDRIQIVGIPIVVASSDLTTAAPVIIYTAPDDPKNADGDWPSEIVSHMHLVHEVVVIPSGDGPAETPFDQIIAAGRSGVECLWYNGQQWKTKNVGKGLPETPGDPYWGAGSVAVGRVDKDYAGYIASAEVRTIIVDILAGLTRSVGFSWQHRVGLHEGTELWSRHYSVEVDKACIGRLRLSERQAYRKHSSGRLRRH